MAKKYLLYIHPPNFELEKNKSKLVNELLVEHYADKLIDVIRTDAVAESTPQARTFVPPKTIIKEPEDIVIVPTTFAESIDKLFFKPCKHGVDPLYCKFAKNGRPCK